MWVCLLIILHILFVIIHFRFCGFYGSNNKWAETQHFVANLTIEFSKRKSFSSQSGWLIHKRFYAAKQITLWNIFLINSTLHRNGTVHGVNIALCHTKCFCITKSFQVKSLHYDSFGFVGCWKRMHAYGSDTCKVPQVFIPVIHQLVQPLLVQIFRRFSLHFSFVDKWKYLTYSQVKFSSLFRFSIKSSWLKWGLTMWSFYLIILQYIFIF